MLNLYSHKNTRHDKNPVGWHQKLGMFSLLVPKWLVVSTSLSFLNKMELRTVLKMSYESSRTKERGDMQIKRDINFKSFAYQFA